MRRPPRLHSLSTPSELAARLLRRPGSNSGNLAGLGLHRTDWSAGQAKVPAASCWPALVCCTTVSSCELVGDSSARDSDLPNPVAPADRREASLGRRCTGVRLVQIARMPPS